jgi:CopA family copper-resistance protein
MKNSSRKKFIYVILLFFSCAYLSCIFAADRRVDLYITSKQKNIRGCWKEAIVVNGQLPAPTLHFREGDNVTINVWNYLHEGTSIHWHGILLPWYMDGVDNVSQRPIPPGCVFHYQFKIRQTGTYWYHAHTHLQEQEGLYGAFIIDPIKPPAYKYTQDYVIVLSDWSNTPAEQIFRNLKKDGEYYSPRFPLQSSLSRFLYDYAKATPKEKKDVWEDYLSMQYTRMGIYDFSDVAYDAYLLNGESCSHPWAAPVKVGDVVRLRFIGAAASTIFKVKIPCSIMKMVNVQGHDVDPYDVIDFTIAPGETCDVLVKIKKDQPYIIYAESSDTLGAAYGALITHPNQCVDFKSVRPFPEPLPVTREMMANMMGHGGHEMSGMGQGHQMQMSGMGKGKDKQMQGMMKAGKHQMTSMTSGSPHQMSAMSQKSGHQMSGMGTSSHQKASMDHMNHDSPKMKHSTKSTASSMHSRSPSSSAMMAMPEKHGGAHSSGMTGMTMSMSMKPISGNEQPGNSGMSKMPDMSDMKMKGMSNSNQKSMEQMSMWDMIRMMITGKQEIMSTTMTMGTKYQNIRSSFKTNDPNKPYTIIKMSLFGWMDRYIWFINGVPEYRAHPIIIEAGKRYRLIFTNASMMHHPMHIHGHFFILRNGNGAYDPLLHTIDVAPGSNVVADFDANEVGQWFFHCHHLYHMVAGMSRVFQYSTLFYLGESLNHCQKIRAFTPQEEKNSDYRPCVDAGLLKHPQGHHAGFFKASFIDIGADPFNNIQKLSFKSLIGPDYDKLELYTEDAEMKDGKTDNFDMDIFYWHLISQFWAIKGGVNYFYRPAVTPYWQPGIGIEGLMYFFIDTNLRLYHHSGSTKLDLQLSRDTQLTNNFFIRTGIRSILATKTVEHDIVGSGLNQMRYIVKPYYRLMPGFFVFAEYEHEQAHGAYKSLLRKDREETSENSYTFGVMLIL